VQERKDVEGWPGSMHVSQLSELAQRLNATMAVADNDGQRQLFVAVMSALYVTTAVLVVLLYVCLIYAYGSSSSASTSIWTSKLQTLLEHHHNLNELNKREPYDRRTTIC
jgi:hypothetical protein